MKLSFYQEDLIFKLYKLSYQTFNIFLPDCVSDHLLFYLFLIHFMLKLENLIIVVERNSEQKDRKMKASEFLVASHNCRITVHCVL